MSDPVSNAEIEDVLSSIRRLVSVDNRQDKGKDFPNTSATKPVEKAEPAAEESRASEARERAPAEEARLVLGPSFRIDPAQEDGADARRVDADEPEIEETSEDTSDHLTLDAWQLSPDTQEIEEPQEDTAQDDEADAYELASEAAEGHGAAQAEPAHDTGVSSEDDAEWDAADLEDNDLQARDWLEREEVEAQDAVEAWNGDAADDAEALSDASGSEESAPEMPEPRDRGEASLQAFEDAVDTPFEYADFAGPDADDRLERDDEEEAATTSELEARIAEVEAAVAAREDQWEPDGASSDDYAGGKTDPLPWEDHVAEEAAQVDETEAEVVLDAEDAEEHVDPAELSDEEDEHALETAEAEAPAGTAKVAELHAAQAMPEPEQAEEPAMTEAVPPPPRPDRFSARTTQATDGTSETWYSDDADTILDEDALRDLVSEIVRQELQGSLGERITRNVRKLVRREIHRAMMGQDFD